jgi:hypothetical protein
LTLYVESNFVLQVVLGQEELTSAEKILTAAESGTIELALPTFSLSESFVRISRGIRDRQRLRTQFAEQVTQLVRSSPHANEMAVLQTVPNHLDQINTREGIRLAATVERILKCTRPIDFNASVFQGALNYEGQFDLDVENAIILSSIMSDLQSNRGLRRHVFVTSNRAHFGKPDIVAELRRVDCDSIWDFSDVVRHLGL